MDERKNERFKAEMLAIIDLLESGQICSFAVTTVLYDGQTKIVYDFDQSNLVAELALRGSVGLLADDIASDYASQLPDNQPE